MTNLDLRYNPGCTLKIKQLVALALLKNIDKLKRTKIEVKKRWLNPSLLIIDFDQFEDPVAATGGLQA